MKLTIIPIDGAVYVDYISYLKLVWEGTPADVHALQWQDTEGWIEYKDVTVPNEVITVLPQWADNAMAAWTVANTPVPPSPPTAEENKDTASSLLLATDWTTIADVADPINSPYLANQADFIIYRNLVRQIAVYPTAGDLVWPIKPDEVWK